MTTCPHGYLYFTVFLEEAAEYIAELEAYWEERAQAQENLEKYLTRRVRCMKESELQEAFLDLLFSGPEWRLERFLDTYDDFYEE